MQRNNRLDNSLYIFTYQQYEWDYGTYIKHIDKILVQTTKIGFRKMPFVPPEKKICGMIINNLTGETFNSFDDMINGRPDQKAVNKEYIRKPTLEEQKDIYYFNMQLNETINNFDKPANFKGPLIAEMLQSDYIPDGPIVDKPIKMFTENYLQKMFICGYLAGRKAKEEDLINDIADGNMLKAFENAKKLLSNDR